MIESIWVQFVVKQTRINALIHWTTWAKSSWFVTNKFRKCSYQLLHVMRCVCIIIFNSKPTASNIGNNFCIDRIRSRQEQVSTSLPEDDSASNIYFSVLFSVKHCRMYTQTFPKRIFSLFYFWFNFELNQDFTNTWEILHKNQMIFQKIFKSEFIL